MGLDNCIVEIDGPEVPILDGSALPFVRLFHAAGFDRQDAAVRPLSLGGRSRSPAESARSASRPDGEGPDDHLRDRFPASDRRQTGADLSVRPEEFAARIAPARTFGFLREVEALRARGLARGGSLQNAVVLDDNGILSGPLRFRDEFVRHKILDLLGDLALLGRPLHGRIHAQKAGHALHIELARAILQAVDRPEARESVAVPDRLRARR